MEEGSNILSLTKQDTAVLKGIAIIAMLMHHLWGCPPAGVESYTGISGFLGSVGKVCVAIFLFCSGYGLSVGYSKIVDNAQCTAQSWKCRVIATLKFLAKRFVKFYSGYWPIFLIFVPISVFVFDRPLSAAYGENVNYIKHIVIDLLGVHSFNSYNITWWFNQLIICFYLLFPILYKLVEKFGWVVLVCSIIVMIVFGECSIWKFYGLSFWVLPFIVGIFACQMSKTSLMKNLQITSYKWLYLMGLIVLLGILLMIRYYVLRPHYNGAELDGLIAVVLACVIVLCRSAFHISYRILPFMGDHSMNIYLTHTFFFSYWFPTFFYSCELGGGMNIIALLAICVFISILIQKLKVISRWDNGMHWLISKI